MADTYLTGFGTRETPQRERAREDQLPNSEGGFVWQVSDWTRLERFLILGSEGGSYYASERDLTRENVDSLKRCLAEDGERFVETVAEVSESGRAPKNGPAIFALALAAGEGDEPTRRRALDALPRVCRTGTHLFQFAEFVEGFRGWGRQLRRAVGEWYEREDLDALAYQLIKYRQRAGWSHRDLLRLAHVEPPTARHNALFGWVTTGDDEPGEGYDPDLLPDHIDIFERAQTAQAPADTVALIEEVGNRLPREAIKDDHLADPAVNAALFDSRMPMTALIRNLANLTRYGVLTPMGERTKRAVEQITDQEALRKARVHPIAVLSAMCTYESARGVRGSGEWEPVREIVDALDGAFYLAFENVEPTGKRHVLGVDVSSSMTYGNVGGVMGFTPNMAAAAMALITASRESDYVINGFAHNFRPLNISPRQRLTDAMRATQEMSFGGTDASLPMLWAAQNKVEADAFVVYTDSETWAGEPHPFQALRQYREQMGIPAKLIVVGLVSNGFSIADPDDGGMMDCVGFDASAPVVMSDFVR